jgi:glycosyltransferase involved in cell wall biosynthesis
MVSDPLVSIVLPVYNGERYLMESIRSCLDQAYHRIELIVVDDCSTDSTPAILDGLDDDRVRRLRNETNLGLARTLNVGFRESTGDYLTWTSDDNLYTGRALSQMVSYLEEHPEPAFVYADYWNMDEHGRVVDRVHLKPPEYLKQFNCVNACFLYRRSVYKVVGEYDADAALSEDYDYWLRVHRTFQMAHLPEPLYCYRRHPYSLTAMAGIVKQQQAAERARSRWVGPDPHRFPSRLGRNVGRVLMDRVFEAHREERWRDRRTCLLRALYYDPRYLANRGVRSLLARSLVRLATGTEGGDL